MSDSGQSPVLKLAYLLRHVGWNTNVSGLYTSLNRAVLLRLQRSLPNLRYKLTGWLRRYRVYCGSSPAHWKETMYLYDFCDSKIASMAAG